MRCSPAIWYHPETDSESATSTWLSFRHNLHAESDDPGKKEGLKVRQGQRIVFVSPVQPFGGCSPNVHGWDKDPSRVKIAMSFLNHPGLCFLKANVPCEILEYPTEADYAALLESRPDVVGISFYINESEIAIKMVDQARRAGVKEVWAGNFGAYSPEIAHHFDRVFKGWGEAEAAMASGGGPVSMDNLVHPEMYGAIGTNLFPRMIMSGILFTSRGCPWTCNFCQTPEFYGKATCLPLESIDRILWTYRKRGVTGINILDENFGTYEKHADSVTELLQKYGMRWIALTRVDTLAKNFDKWKRRGLFGAHLGIESLNQGSLQGADKRIDEHASVELLHMMSRHNMFVQAFYIIGFEEDTVDSVRRDITTLAGLDVDVVQVQVLTPFPRTEQRENIETKHGLTDRNLSHYNSRNLVWKHPHISPEQMRELQNWAHARLTSSRRSLRTMAKFAIHFGRPGFSFGGTALVARSFLPAQSRLHKEYRRNLKSARQWAKTGWYNYEEVSNAESRTAIPVLTPVVTPDQPEPVL